ncbi:MAG: ATP synthase F0 subunit B [Planctomycetaceae bacterium]
MSRFRILMLGIVTLSFLTFAPVTALAEEKAEKGGDAHAADDHGDHEGEAHASGPPLDPRGEKGEGTDLVIFSIIAFLLFVFALKALAWGPLISGLDKREADRRQAAAETQHALTKAEELLKEHEAKLASTQDEVREIIAEARRDAERTSQDIIAAAQGEAESSRNRAVEEIGRAKDVALNELFDGMAGQVTGATEHVLGRALNDSDQDRLVEDALQQVANS